MSVIKLTLPGDHALEYGQFVTFTAPCACVSITALKIGGVEYRLCDSLGNSLASKDAFAEDALVTVAIDTINKSALVQNSSIVARATNVENITNNDIGDNANVNFAIGDKSFYKVVNKVAEATKATKDGHDCNIVDTYVRKSQTINGKKLSSSISLGANDVGAAVMKLGSTTLKTVTFTLSGATLNITTT